MPPETGINRIQRYGFLFFDFVQFFDFEVYLSDNNCFK